MSYVKQETGRENMEIWQGTCIVHATFPVRRLIDDPQLAAAMGRAARERVQEKFSVDLMVTNTLAVYREVLGC